MTIELHPPLALHEQGQRDGNEDCIYPPLNRGAASDKVFLVCDGVGGAEKGEEASRIACQAFAEILEPIDEISTADVERALQRSEAQMDEFIMEHPHADGMATTLTLFTHNSEGALIAHVGDSRVYQFRDGEIIFKTSDHSLVNELLINNIITEEQAATHPNRNVVSRAIMGSQRPTKVDVALITDVKPDDYFILCTDGVLESVSDSYFREILSNKTSSDEDKLSLILTLCLQGSRDNFSAYLLRVKSVGGVGAATPQQDGDLHEADPLNPTNKRTKHFLKVAALATTVMVVIMFLLYARRPNAGVEHIDSSSSDSSIIQQRTNLGDTTNDTPILYTPSNAFEVDSLSGTVKEPEIDTVGR